MGDAVGGPGAVVVHFGDASGGMLEMDIRDWIWGLGLGLGVASRIWFPIRGLDFGVEGKNTLPFTFLTMMSPWRFRSIAFPTPFRPLQCTVSFFLLTRIQLFLILLPITLRYPPRIHKHRLRIRNKYQHEHHITNPQLLPRQRRRLQIVKKHLRRIS